MDCGAHVGLARCYCGWSASGGDGRAELVEMGETIGDEYPDSDTFFSREVPWEVEQDWDYLGDDT